MSRKTRVYDVVGGFRDETFEKRPLLPNLGVRLKY